LKQTVYQICFALFNHLSFISDNSIVPNDTSCALAYLKNLFPVEKFEGRLPPIILQHQLYAIVSNRTLVDQQLVCNSFVIYTPYPVL